MNHTWDLSFLYKSFEDEAFLADMARLPEVIAGEKAILARLRTMTDVEFEALPYGSEGLWRKLMHES